MQHQGVTNRVARTHRACIALLAALAITASTLPAKADGNDSIPVLMGPMPLSCGGWLQARSAAHDYPFNESQYEMWVTGFMSGLVVASHVAAGLKLTDPHGRQPIDAAGVLNTTDIPSIDYAIDNACQNTPLEDLSEAVDQVFNQLVLRAAPGD